jgi:ligand-binding SRPBCC domain-containing protein
MSHHLQFEQWVAFPPEHVFAFFSDPRNLPRLMPARSDTKIIRLDRVPPPSIEGMASNEAAGVGSVIVTSFRIFPHLPFRAQWIARIVEFEWNHHFADVRDADVRDNVQDEGSFRSWHHRHEFIAQTQHAVEGTLVRDTVDYEVGFGVLGRIANQLFVTRQMRQTFLARQRVLESLL